MPAPVRKAVADIKSQLFNPALTSHFQCYFQPPQPVIDWINQQSSVGYGLPYDNRNDEFISIACMEASLPGSNLMTHEQTNDFHGITERHAYRRDYGTGADFTFMVDNNHNIIFFFENWIRYIVNERHGGTEDYPDMYNYTNGYSRVNYPNNYKAPYGLYISKFERDYEGSLGITYQFLNAYPTSITSMPISYESSQLLKCTVTFTYTRYIAAPSSPPNVQPAQNTAIPLPVINYTGGARRQDLDIWALQNQSMIRSVGTADQRALLRDVQSFYGGNSGAQQNLQRLTNQGGYTAGTNGAFSGQALPGTNLNFATLSQPVGNAPTNPLLGN